MGHRENHPIYRVFTKKWFKNMHGIKITKTSKKGGNMSIK